MSLESVYDVPAEPELPDLMLAERRTSLIICNRLAKAAFSVDPDILNANLRHYEGAPAHERYQRFGQAAERSFADAFRDQLNVDVYGGASVGFPVLQRLLAIAPSAYQKYCTNARQAAQVSELRHSLLASTETVQRFMDLPNNSNSRAESIFGLKNTRGDEAPYFRFIKDRVDGLLFLADDEQFAIHSRPLEYHEDLPPHWQRCPARRLVIERIWPAMVEAAASNPWLFPRDLATTPS